MSGVVTGKGGVTEISRLTIVLHAFDNKYLNLFQIS